MYTTRELKPKIGTQITTDADTLLSGAIAKDIREILHDRGVIVFGNMNLSDEQHYQLAASLGTIGPDYNNPRELQLLLSNAQYETGAFLWHIDDISEEVPHYGSIMSSRKLPVGGGGETEWSNAVAAYDDLPDSDKALIEDLKVVHSFEAAQRFVIPWPTYDVLQSWREFGSRTVPMVWRHTDGRKSLVLGSSASHIEGMDLSEGRALLCRLTEWATKPEYVYTQDWTPGDLIMWNNATTLHRARPYRIGTGRASARVALVGEEAVPA